MEASEIVGADGLIVRELRDLVVPRGLPRASFNAEGIVASLLFNRQHGGYGYALRIRNGFNAVEERLVKRGLLDGSLIGRGQLHPYRKGLVGIESQGSLA